MCRQVIYPLAAFIRWPRFHLVLFLLCLLILVSMSAQPAQAQVPCKTALEEAEDEYDFDRFGRAIALLEACLKSPDGFKDEALTIRAYKLVALSYIALDDSIHARQNISKILDLKPDYDPRLDLDSEQDPPLFSKLVNEIKKEREDAVKRREKWKRLRLMGIIGSGALAAGTIVYFLTRPDPRLPDPPGPPNL
jgi:hypothetical protein